MLGFALPVSCPNANPILSWRCWPLVDDRLRGLLCLGTIFAVGVLVMAVFGHVLYMILAVVLLMMSLGRFVLPSWFELNGQGATVRFLGHARQLRWSDVGRASIGRTGVFLSPFAKPSRLDSFRGVWLPFAGNADEVSDFVREQTTADAETA